MKHMMKASTLKSVLLGSILLLVGFTIALAAPTSETEKQWQVYYDQDYNFTVEYPVDGWQPDTPWHILDAKPSSIAKRTIFFGEQARIIIDIWDHPQEDMVNWVHDYLYKTDMDQKITINAQIAGFPGVAFIEENEQAPTAIGVAFNDNNHFFLIQYLIGDNGDGMDTYLHLLKSFTLKTENNEGLGTAGDFVFPLNIEKEALQKSHALLGNTCCGFTSSGNPFPCDNGNCTWWVWYKMSGVPMTGDAWLWGHRVDMGLYPGWYLAENPKAHYIAWWDKSTARPYGHVAYIQWKSGANTLIKVNEMTWQGNTCANEPVTRYISLPSTGEPTGYIVR